MAFDYPVMLDLEGVDVLLVGGGVVAERKLAGLTAAGARVTVVAPSATSDVQRSAAQWHQREYRLGDVNGHRLVITATDEPTVNRAVAEEARAAGVWVNSADDPANCTFALPAVARDGVVTVAVSTGGASPALASHLRRQLQDDLHRRRVGRVADILAAQRAEFHRDGISTETIDWAPRVAAAFADATDPTDGPHALPT